jgi:hypothetical protein
LSKLVSPIICVGQFNHQNYLGTRCKPNSLSWSSFITRTLSSRVPFWSASRRAPDLEASSMAAGTTGGGEICYYGDPHVWLRRFGGVGEGLADMEKQGIDHSLKRTRALYYLLTSLIKTMDTHVVYIRYLSPSSRRSFLLFSSFLRNPRRAHLRPRQRLRSTSSARSAPWPRRANAPCCSASTSQERASSRCSTPSSC